MMRLLFAACLVCALGVRLTAEDANARTLELPIEDVDRDHWSFRPIATPNLPSVENTAWPRTAIDRFILRRLERKGLTPADEADRSTLMRRLCFDLHGLPPTPKQRAEFVLSDRPGAYSRLGRSTVSGAGFRRALGAALA